MTTRRALLAFASLALIAAIALPRESRAQLLPTPTPSFSAGVTVTAGSPQPTISVPGEEAVAGQSYIFTGPDGTQYHVYDQINRLLTPAPTATPTPAPLPPVITSLDDPAFTYFGTWGVYTGTEKYGGSDHFTSDVTASYGFLFTGTAVAVYTQTAPWMANASFSLDGGAATEFDAYAATATQGVVAFSADRLTPGVHRIVVRHTGRWNPSAYEHQMTVDRADITDGAIISPLSP